MVLDTKFKKGQKPYLHKEGCKCFRCDKNYWKIHIRGNVSRKRNHSLKTKNKIRNTIRLRYLKNKSGMGFRKGYIPWNKGKKLGPLNDKRKQRISNALKGRKFTKIWKKRMSLARKGKYFGKNNPAWKGGLTSEIEKQRASMKLKKWRNRVFKRDNFTCKMCGKIGGRIHPHHIFKFSEFPKKRFSLKNGITLCVKCHKKTFQKENQFIEVFLAKQANSGELPTSRR